MILLFLAWAAQAEPTIVERPLPFTAERFRLSLEYLAEHADLHPADASIDPKVVVVHWTATPSLDASWNTFESATLAGRSELQTASALNVSAHFLVDRDGTIYRLMPDNRMARHCIGLNHIAIGIENVGGGDAFPLTDAQLSANAALVRYLAENHEITHVIGHSEYRSFEGHPYFRETDPKYRTTKPDPGPEFMTKLRAQLTDLHLQGPPTPCCSP